MIFPLHPRGPEKVLGSIPRMITMVLFGFYHTLLKAECFERHICLRLQMKVSVFLIFLISNERINIGKKRLDIKD